MEERAKETDRNILHMVLNTHGANGTLVPRGTQITITYRMTVAEDAPADSKIENSFKIIGWYYVDGIGEKEFWEAGGGETDPGEVAEYTDTRLSFVKGIKGAEDDEGNSVDYTQSLVDGNWLTFSMTLESTRSRNLDLVTHSFVDHLPSVLFDTDTITDVSAQVFSGAEANPTNIRSVGVTVQVDPDTKTTMTGSAIPGQPVHFQFDSPVTLQGGEKLQVLFKVQLDAAEYLTDETNNITTSKAFTNYAAAMLPKETSDYKIDTNGKGTLKVDTSTDLDRYLNGGSYDSSATKSYIQSSASFTLYRNDLQVASITKTVSSGTSATILEKSPNQTRKYTVTITNRNATALEINKVVDRLPQFETLGSNITLTVGGKASTILQTDVELKDVEVTKDGEVCTIQSMTVSDWGSGARSVTIPARGTMTLVYTTSIDAEAFRAYMQDQSRTVYTYTDTNAVAMYSSKPITLSGGGEAKDDGGNDDWDNNANTTVRYQASASVNSTYIPIRPTIHLTAMASEVDPFNGTVTFVENGNQAINPGSQIGWDVSFFNRYTNANSPMENAAVVLVLDDELSVTGWENLTGTPLTGDPLVSTTSEGRTILVWPSTNSKLVNANTGVKFRVITQSHNTDLRQYNAEAYLIPNEYFYQHEVESLKQTYSFAGVGMLGYDLLDEGLVDFFESYEEQEGYRHAVYDDDQIKLFGDLGTNSLLTIIELGSDHASKTGNTKNSDSSSSMTGRTIEVQEKDVWFQYDLEVTSMGKGTYSDIVLINRLPHANDLTELGGVNRYSDVGAKIADGSFTASIYRTDSKKTETLSPGQFVIQYATSEGGGRYSEDDWSGTGGQWTSAADYSGSLENVRALRAVFDDSVVLQTNDVLTLSYKANFREEELVSDGQVAYNSFGYAYNGNYLSSSYRLKSDPRTVGITLPTLPGDRIIITKNVNGADKYHPETEFTFTIYEYDALGEIVGTHGTVTLTLQYNENTGTWSSGPVQVLEELDPLPPGHSYALGEQTPLYIYTTTGLDTYAETPESFGNGLNYYFVVDNDLVPMTTITITKILAVDEEPEDTEFIFDVVGTNEKGAVEYNLPHSVTVEKVGGYYTGTTVIYNLDNLDYTVTERLDGLNGDYDVTSPAVVKGPGTTTNTWYFEFTNTPKDPDADKEEYVEIEKILKEDTDTPSNTSFDVRLDAYLDGELVNGESSQHTITLQRDASGFWRGTTGLIPANAAYDYQVVEITEGYDVTYLPPKTSVLLDGGKTITHTYFTVVNTPPMDEETKVEIQKVLMENKETPSVTSVDVVLNAYKDGKSVAKTPYTITLDRDPYTGYWVGTTGQLPADPSYTYNVEEITEGYEVYYAINRTEAIVDNVLVTTWVLTVNNTNPEDGPKDGKDGEDGKDGNDGKDGEDGKDGSDGKDGEDGKDGNNGKDGSDGRDGNDGRDSGRGGSGGGRPDRPDRDPERPDRGTTINDDPIPLTSLDDQPIPLADFGGLTTILDENIPLGGLPTTGGGGKKRGGGLLALLGVALAALLSRRSDDED